MNRTLKLKIAYFIVFLAFGSITIYILFQADNKLTTALAMALVLFLPGRIQGFFYRAFFTGRHLLDKHYAQESILYFEKFIKQVNKLPLLNKLLWLSWSVYTISVKAMTLNNLGVANLEIGELDLAEEYLTTALKLDHLYPIPYWNLAAIHMIKNNHDRAKECANKAYELGYKQSTMDKVISRSQSLLALIEAEKYK